MVKVDINNLEESRRLLERFKDDYLNNDISNLVNFSFWTLLDDYDNAYENSYLYNEKKEKKESYQSRYDGDRLNIVYAINKILYQDKNIPNFNDNLGKIYTGDTINTYRTLFGNKFCHDSDGLDGQKRVEIKYGFNDGSPLLKLRDEFFKTYQTIGNFYLLPKEKNKKSSINTYRGKCKWKDYFDVFLQHLAKCLNKDISKEEIDLNYYLELPYAKDFFSKFNEIEKICDLFFMKDYLDFTFKHTGLNYYAHFNTPGSSMIEYKKFCMSFIEDSSTKIFERSNKIIKELQKKGF